MMNKKHKTLLEEEKRKTTLVKAQLLNQETNYKILKEQHEKQLEEMETRHEKQLQDQKETITKNNLTI